MQKDAIAQLHARAGTTQTPKMATCRPDLDSERLSTTARRRRRLAAVVTVSALSVALGCADPNSLGSFRGFGNEPGWTVEVADSLGVRFTFDYGQATVSLPRTGVTIETGDATITYRGEVDGRRLLVEITERHCADTMADDTFDFAVRVTLDQRAFAGCGRRM